MASARLRLLGCEPLEGRILLSGGALSNALPLNLASAPIAQVSGAVSADMPVQYYQFNAPGTGVLNVQLQSPTPGVLLDLDDANGQTILDSAGQSNIASSDQISQYLVAGVYYVGVERTQADAAFTLTTTWQNPLPAAISDATNSSTNAGYSLGTLLSNIVTADFNNDGNTDFAVVSQPDGGSTSPAQLNVMLGNGDGTFQQVTTQLSFPINQLIACDMNGMGLPDLVGVENGVNPHVVLLLSNGDGTFTPGPDLTLNGFTTFPANSIAPSDSPVALGYFTENGLPGLALIGQNNPSDGQSGTNSLRLILSNGDGTYRVVQQDLPLTGTPFVAAGDLNGDGQSEIIVGSQDSNSLLILQIGADGQLHTVGSLPVPAPLGGLLTADFNGDGVGDIAALTGLGQPGSSLVVWDGQANGLPIPAGSYSAPTQPYWPAGTSLTAFANADGSQSLVAWTPAASSAKAPDSSGTLVAYLQQPDGSLAPQMLGPTPDGAFTFADLNNDGTPDLIQQDASGAVTVLLATPDLSYYPVADLPHPSYATPLEGDLTGSGIDDLVVLTSDGEIVFRRGLPGAQPTYALPVVINPVSDPAADIALVDSNGQVLLAALDEEAESQRIMLYAYDAATGGFTATAGPDLSNTPAVAIASGDLTGDGNDDLVAVSPADNCVLVFYQRPDGSFASQADIAATVGSTPDAVVLTDLTGDGRLDIVTTNQTSGDVSVLLNTPKAPFTQEERFRTGLDGPHVFEDPSTGDPSLVGSSTDHPTAVTVGDFMGNGQTELLVLDAGAGTVQMLYASQTGAVFDPDAADSFTLPTGADVVVTGPMNGSNQQWIAVLDCAAEQVRTYTLDDQEGLTLLGVEDVGAAPSGMSVQRVVQANGQVRYDLLVGTEQGDVLRLQGNGDGTFQPYQCVLDDVALAVGDLTGNGATDFIVVDQDLGRVSLVAGNSQTVIARNIAGLITPGMVQLADLTGNGIPDLIICNPIGNSVLIYPGLGGGEFGPELNGGLGFTTGIDPTSVTVARLGNDPYPELLVTDAGSDDVTILQSRNVTGHWTLVPVERLQAGAGPTSAVLADLSGDGVPDLIVTDSRSDQVRIFTGRDDGSFDDDSPRILPTGENPTESYVGDFDGDGHLDLVTLDTGSNDLTFYSDVASPQSVGQRIASGGEGPIDALVRTVNGKSDLIVANYTDGRVALFVAGANGPELVGSLESPGGHPTSLAANPSSADPWSVFVVDAGSESATAINFSSLLESLSPLLSGESAKDSAAERSPQASLQPLSPTTVGVVPTLLTGEEGNAEEGPAVSSMVSPSAGAVSGATKTESPAPVHEAGIDDQASEELADGATGSAAVEEAPVQRFLLGVDETSPPAVGPDGATESSPAMAVPSPPKIDPPAAERRDGPGTPRSASPESSEMPARPAADVSSPRDNDPRSRETSLVGDKGLGTALVAALLGMMWGGGTKARPRWRGWWRRLWLADRMRDSRKG